MAGKAREWFVMNDTGCLKNSKPIQTAIFHEPINIFTNNELEWKAETVTILKNNISKTNTTFSQFYSSS